MDITWTAGIKAKSYIDYGTMVEIGGIQIVDGNPKERVVDSMVWHSETNYDRTSTKNIKIRVPASATQTSVNISATYWSVNANDTDMVYYYNKGYKNSTTLTIPIPTY